MFSCCIVFSTFLLVSYGITDCTNHSPVRNVTRFLSCQKQHSQSHVALTSPAFWRQSKETVWSLARKWRDLSSLRFYSSLGAAVCLQEGSFYWAMAVPGKQTSAPASGTATACGLCREARPPTAFLPPPEHAKSDESTVANAYRQHLLACRRRMSSSPGIFLFL